MESKPTRLRVLVVEDDENARKALAAVIGTEHDVFTASNGSEALDLCADEAIDVVCTDYQMPTMTGLELLREMDGRGMRVGVVLVTGMADAFRATSHRSLGNLFYTVLLKPYEPERLLMDIRRAGVFTAMNRSVEAASAASANLGDSEEPER